MKIIIGSTALKYYFPDFPRTPKDLDYVVLDSSLYEREKDVEYLENPILLKYEKEGYISPNMLLTLKMSHMFWDVNWDKHAFDIQFLLSKGCSFNPEILQEFIDYWKAVKPKVRRSDLKLSKEDFFTNSINDDVHQHDYLHTLLNPIPMYTRLLKEGSEVELDESKFHSMSHEDKLEVVREEVMIMAMERYKHLDYRSGYKIQLKTCIQKHFPTYIGIFAILNYKELHMPKYNYIETINTKLDTNGITRN